MNANAQTMVDEIEQTDSIDNQITQVMDQLTDKAMLHAPLSIIKVREGFNPRRFFDPEKLDELARSVKLQGVIQPIVVKPNDENNGFFLIAGERRFRAAKLAKLDTIPVIVRLVSDQEALTMALSENIDRDDMSPSEEAKACHRMMSFVKGDKEEAAQSLGWSQSKLESRLSLLHCTESVLNALEERKIKIGHAELLATLTKEMQNQSLTGIIERSVSVGELKQSIGRYAYQLSDAVFSVDSCTNCSHNSSSTTDMFDTHLDSGQCLNRECYDFKTKSFLTDKKKELEEKYPVIFLDIEKPSETRCYLVREGSSGVGKEQYDACMGCASYGALLLTEKGREGQIEEDICFDVTCNTKKVNALLKEQRGQLSVVKNDKDDSPEKETKNSTAPKSKAKKTVAETPKRVLDHVHKAIHAAAGKEVFEDNKMIRIYSIIALADAHKGSLTESMVLPVLKQHNVKKLFASSHSNGEKIEELYPLEDKALSDLIKIFASAMAGENQSESYSGYLDTAKTTLKLCGADMTKHFVIDQDYLETLTIKGLYDLMSESGFFKWFDSQDGKQKGDCDKQILKGKRDDQIKAIIKAGFNWKGFIPKTLSL
jgi:ParB family transcriptional regulator, chromosome partitioning protein